jgi:pimeloyl-ACP methyl ester carboxylesterase
LTDGTSSPSGLDAGTPIAQVLWLSPGEREAALRSVEFVARALEGRAEIVPKSMEVWDMPEPVSYSLEDEVEGVRRLADRSRWSRFHLVGFSAGGTVALICARVMPGSVATVTVIEPATIGDDRWSNAEAEWRTRMHTISELAELFSVSRATIYREVTRARGRPVSPVAAPLDIRTHDRGLENVATTAEAALTNAAMNAR